ncbi:hypothetical protein [Glaciihabitans arcticus]|uniref:hypothetical protein n=1 Tax=Glaciihabitans arcticus TaxID=2668039 RepID=UPI001959D6CA|nr:hypothetical protein [Glaciihabitans arcticus]
MAVEDYLSSESAALVGELGALRDPLDRLRGIRSLIAALEADAASLTAVRAALDGGATWDHVASAANLSATAAKWRWQGSDAEIAARLDAGRKRAARPSSKPTDLPGLSVAEAAKQLGVSVQAVYLRVSRGTLRAETVTLDDGRSFKRVFVGEAE